MLRQGSKLSKVMNMLLMYMTPMNLLKMNMMKGQLQEMLGLILAILFRYEMIKLIVQIVKDVFIALITKVWLYLITFTILIRMSLGFFEFSCNRSSVYSCTLLFSIVIYGHLRVMVYHDSVLNTKTDAH